MMASSRMTPGQIEEQLEPHLVRREGGRKVRPRKWDRYAHGKIGPSDASDADPVSLAESAWPGTANWYRSLVWRALDQRPITESDLNAQLETLQTLRPILFRSSRWNPEVIVPAPAEADLFASLLQHGGLDALAAAMLLARKSEVIASPELRNAALQLGRDLQPELLQLPALCVHGAELFRSIDLNFKEWVFPDPGQRMSVVIFSEEARLAVLHRSADPNEGDHGGRQV